MARTSSPDSASLNDGIPAYDKVRFNTMDSNRRAPYVPTITAMCAASASDAVKPGDSIPKRLTTPATP